MRLIIEAHEPLTGTGAGTHFLTAMGAHLALADQRRRLDLTALDEPRLADLAAPADSASPGYDLVSWTEPTPEGLLDDVAVLIGRMVLDAPVGDLHLTEERWDAQRVRDRDAVRAARGMTSTVTAARGPDGHLVAFTVIVGSEDVPVHASQGDTLVVPAHRGLRLGMRVKLANLARVRAQRPELRMIDTYNADSNTHMVAINEAIGFRPLDRLGEWELPL